VFPLIMTGGLDSSFHGPVGLLKAPHLLESVFRDGVNIVFVGDQKCAFSLRGVERRGIRENCGRSQRWKVGFRQVDEMQSVSKSSALSSGCPFPSPIRLGARAIVASG
jgi:hypothetical protein